MVMPCSRSARSPSVTKERSTACRPRRRLAESSASIWSLVSCLVSWSSRPISVDLPSSTEPTAAKRRRSVAAGWTRPAAWSATTLRYSSGALEVALALAILHGRLGELVVGPGGATLADRGGGHLGDDLVD